MKYWLAVLLLLTTCCSKGHGQTIIQRAALVDSYLVTSADNPTVEPFCQGFCAASTPLTDPITLLCPQPAANSCMVTVNVSSSIAGGLLSIGSYELISDGSLAATYQFASTEEFHTHSEVFTFVTMFSNTTDNQVHTLQINLRCDNIVQGGTCLEQVMNVPLYVNQPPNVSISILIGVYLSRPYPPIGGDIQFNVPRAVRPIQGVRKHVKTKTRNDL